MRSFSKTIVILVAFIILFVIGEIFFVPKQYVDSRIVAGLQWPFTVVKYLGNQQELIRQLSSLSVENQSLRAQLLEVSIRPELIKESASRYISAEIFSSYPFNDLEQILINAGAEAGIKEGQAVLVEPGVFLGKIIKVNDTTSLVQTIFNPGWEIPVKIGVNKVGALYIGSRDPKLTLISKNKSINAGESVYLSSKEFPLGALIGSVGDALNKEAGLFKESDFTPAYNLKELSRVLVLLK